MTTEDKISLTELQRVIRDKLYEALPGFYWVIAEIAEHKVNVSGHCYLELIDTETPGGKVTAKARATIWASKYRSINACFSSATGIPLHQGITILLRATVEYSELYGLSLNISDIDPAYTAGDMALKREAVIRQLKADGVIEMNQELEMPLYPRNIAVVSSEKAAGYLDFVKHIQTNTYGYIFNITLFNAVMQGDETESSVAEALDRVAASSGNFDVVAIIRGGGSATDLGWFDNYRIAYHVTQFPLPVLTGIGHQKDLTVTDMVAWRSLKTPTAVADFLIETTLAAESHIEELATRIASLTGEMINDAGEHLLTLRNRIINASQMLVKVRSEQLTHITETLRVLSKSVLRHAVSVTDNLDTTLKYLEPARVLQRGYTLTTREGKILRSAEGLKAGDTIETHFENDTAASTISGIRKRKVNDEKNNKTC